MDFGGYADEDRFAYYQFLKSKEYESFIASFKGKDGLKVFDIDWFSFIGYLRRGIWQLHGHRFFYDSGSFTFPDSDCRHRLFIYLQFTQRAYGSVG